MLNKIVRRLLRTPYFRARIKEIYRVAKFYRVQYDEDGLMTKHVPHFLDKADFQKALQAGEATGAWAEWPMRWRVHVALWCGRMASRLEGDFVECGVDKGGLSRAICEDLDFASQNRKFWLVDSFESIDLQRIAEEELAVNDYLHNRNYGGTLDRVKSAFAAFPNVQIAKGFIPEILDEVQPEKVAYLSVDLNNAAPEMDAIAHFWQRIVPGGIVLLDDYAFDQKFEKQRKAWDDWAAREGVEILSVATGQGLIMKDIR